MQPILAQELPLAGFIQSFPRAIVHGPWQWGGLNIPNIYTEQLISHVHLILKFGGWLEEITGSLLQASWEALQLEAGLAGNIFTYPEAVQDYMTTTWLSQTWAACQKANIQIISQDTTFTPKRNNDVKLMRVFIQQGYQKNDLKCLNQCWMYMQSVYLSDICMVSRDMLAKFWLKSPIQIPSSYKWPLTQIPMPNEWTFWQCALQQAILLGISLTLPIPLSKWA